MSTRATILCSDWWHLFRDRSDERVYFVFEGSAGEITQRIPIALNQEEAKKLFEEVEGELVTFLLQRLSWRG